MSAFRCQNVLFAGRGQSFRKAGFIAPSVGRSPIFIAAALYRGKTFGGVEFDDDVLTNWGLPTVLRRLFPPAGLRLVKEGEEDV